jgi:hypothetical protein
MCLSLVTVVGGSAFAAGTQMLKVTPTLIGPPGDATGCHVNRQQNGYICTVVVSETANSQGSLQWKGRARFASDFVINPNHGTLSPGQQVTVTIIPAICGGNFPLYFIGPQNTVKLIFTCG